MIKCNGREFVAGNLSSDRSCKIVIDLTVEFDLELFHDWKDGSVYLCGEYHTLFPAEYPLLLILYVCCIRPH